MSFEMWAAVLGLAVILPVGFVYKRLAEDRHAVRQARAALDRAVAEGATAAVVQYARAAYETALQRYAERRAAFPERLIAPFMRF